MAALLKACSALSRTKTVSPLPESFEHVISIFQVNIKQEKKEEKWLNF